MMFHKTKAAILNESHKPLLIEEIQLPIKLDAGQVFVEIFYTSICGAQINEIDAVKGVDKFLPHLLGHEACAEVLEIGSGVRHVKPKDIVVLHWRPSLGIEAEPYKYLRENNSIVNAGWVTTFQQYAVISENRMTVIPPWFDKKIAPLLGCAVTTAYGIVNYESQIRTGESVLIIGVGGVGLQIAQFAKLAGADTICAMDIDREKLNSAEKYANMTYLYSEDYCYPYCFDKVVETTGIKKMRELAYELTAPQGTCNYVGVPKEKIEIDSLQLHFGKKLIGSHGGNSKPHIDIPRIIKLIRSNKYSLDDAISIIISLDDINDGIAMMRKGVNGRILVDMSL